MPSRTVVKGGVLLPMRLANAGMTTGDSARAPMELLESLRSRVQPPPPPPVDSLLALLSVLSLTPTKEFGLRRMLACWLKTAVGAVALTDGATISVVPLLSVGSGNPDGLSRNLPCGEERGRPEGSDAGVCVTGAESDGLQSTGAPRTVAEV